MTLGFTIASRAAVSSMCSIWLRLRSSCPWWVPVGPRATIRAKCTDTPGGVIAIISGSTVGLPGGMRKPSRVRHPFITISIRPTLSLEERHRANGGAGATAPFERQADEAELSQSQEALEIAQALDVRDTELQARLVHKCIYLPLRPGAHGVDAEMHNALLCQPLRCCHVHPRIVGCVGGLWKGARVMARAEKHRAALRDGHTRLLYRCLQLGRCD